ncbi:mitochondrial import receptor subunit tom20 [Blastocladiella emersonii ATCC 22665]|nr:mitochondrial import receptor subunit tom20 [Blastocladiella emersonii ATCC 22665]
MSSQSSVAATLQRPWVLATLSVLALGIGYSVWFDYKRRADPSFRRRLRKQRKAVSSRQVETEKDAPAAASASGAATAGASGITAASIPGLEALLTGPLPTTPEEKEAFFMEMLSKGEQLAKMGPPLYDLAAQCFYRALKVYPAPAELVMLYQRTLEEPVFRLIMDLVTNEVKERQAQYFTEHPAADMNVRIREDVDASRPPVDGNPVKRRVLVATKDFNPGETIYTEAPLVAALAPHHLLSGAHCSHCLKATATAAESVLSTKTGLTYCSETCEAEAWEKYESLLFADAAVSGTSTTRELIERCAADNALTPLLMARFLAQMVHEDMVKSQDPTGGETFGAWDHIERLKYLEITTPTADDAKHMEVLRRVLGTKVPGLDEFLTEERYLLLKGKFMYNEYAVNIASASASASSAAADAAAAAAAGPVAIATETETEEEGAEAKIEEVEDVSAAPAAAAAKIPEEPLRSDSPVTTATLAGASVYMTTSYLGHACEPNTAVEFPSKSCKVALVAAKPIAKGDVLTIAFVDTGADHAARAEALKKGWRYTCACAKCQQETMDIE